MATCLTLFFSVAAHAQGGRVDEFIEQLFKKLEDLGGATERVLPRFGPSGPEVVDWGDKATASGAWDQSIPVEGVVTFSIEHSFGEVHVESWDRNTIEIKADYMVGVDPDQAELAREFADSIRFEVDTSVASHVHLKAIMPELPEYDVEREINYRIRLPQRTNLVSVLSIAPIIVVGVNGTVTIDSQFHDVTLSEIGGPVHVSAVRGSVRANKLRGGGTFFVTNCQTEFKDISGELRVKANDGVTIAEGLDQANPVEIFSNNGPLHFYLSENFRADLWMTVQLGQLHSDIPLERKQTSTFIDARLPGGSNSAHRIRLQTSFDDMYIHGPATEIPTTTPDRGQPESTQQIPQLSVPVTAGQLLTVHAARGNLIIEGAETESVTVSSVKLVRLKASDQSTAAFDALTVHVESTPEGGAIVTTATAADMEAIGCTYYRIDLQIQCPYDMAVKLAAEEGDTRISTLLGALDVTQEWGNVEVQGVDGVLLLANKRGNVKVTGSTGPVTVTAKRGEIALEGVTLKQQVVGENCTVEIDEPGDEVNVLNSGGDVTILAFDGIYGRYDIDNANGDIRLVRSDDADVDFAVTVENGQVKHRLPIDFLGTVGSDRVEMRGGLNGKTHSVVLKARNGDVIID